MENASQALIIGFSMLIFVIALTICITMFSQARATSDFVIFKSDETSYYEYDIIDENSRKNTRVVSLETIIPTLYRYYKEDYRVNFIDSEENSLPIYISVTGENINYFDVDEEVNRSEPWIGSQENFKENIDKIVENVLIANYKNREFEEIYSTKIISTSDTETVKDENQKEKIVIPYKLLDKSS